MAAISSTKTFILTEETTYRSAVSEFMIQKLGGSINYALDLEAGAIATNATDISTNAGDITTNANDITTITNNLFTITTSSQANSQGTAAIFFTAAADKTTMFERINLTSAPTNSDVQLKVINPIDGSVPINSFFQMQEGGTQGIYNLMEPLLPGYQLRWNWTGASGSWGATFYFRIVSFK